MVRVGVVGCTGPRALSGLAVIACVMLPAGCGHANGSTSGSATSGQSPGIVVHLSLPRLAVPAGNSMSGRITVDDRSGHALNFVGCGSMFQLLPGGPHYHPQAIQPDCAEQMRIPVGTSSYRVTVNATYDKCYPTSKGGAPKCDANGVLPPLPVGRYQVRTIAANPAVPVPTSQLLNVTR